MPIKAMVFIDGSWFYHSRQILFDLKDETGFEIDDRRVNALSDLRRLILRAAPTSKELQIFEGALDFTQNALRIYMASMGLFGIQIACQMTFTSLGKARESIIVAVTRKFVLLIPLIFIMPAILTGNQTTAVYLAEPIADALAVSFTAVLFSVQFKKAMRAIA